METSKRIEKARLAERVAKAQSRQTEKLAEALAAIEPGTPATLCLSAAELVELTRHRRSDAQRRELDFLNVPCRTRRDGSVVVLRADLSLGPQPAEATSEVEPELTIPDREGSAASVVASKAAQAHRQRRR